MIRLNNPYANLFAPKIDSPINFELLCAIKQQLHTMQKNLEHKSEMTKAEERHSNEKVRRTKWTIT